MNKEYKQRDARCRTTFFLLRGFGLTWTLGEGETDRSLLV